MENQIDELVEQLLTQYKSVAAKIEAVAAADHPVISAEQMAAVKSTLNEIKATQRELFPLRDRFLAAGGLISESIQKRINESVVLVSKMLPQLGNLENAAKSERENLVPKIHDGVRALQMQSAYSSNQ